MMTQKLCAQLVLMGLLAVTGQALAVDSEALGEELRKGQSRSDNQTTPKPIPPKTTCAHQLKH